MTTKRYLVLLLLAAIVSAPLAAGAQTVPIPPVPPVPTVPPIPPMPMPRPEPMTVVMRDLSLLDNMRLSLDGRLVDMNMMQDALVQSRLALTDANFNLFDQDLFKYSTTYGGEGSYTAGKDLLNQRKYAEAIARFDRVIAQKASNVDGALYWKAYAQYKLGKTEEALATIAALRKDHGQSRYLSDARALEADARRMAGQPVNPASMDDDDLKILAINAMKSTDPEKAIPLLENFLSTTNSLRTKKQALYVLAGMSNQPRAHQILLGYAKGGGNPDLQLEAIRYIAAGSNKQAASADLMQIYQNTQDTDVKLAVIGAFRASGNQTGLSYALSSSTTSPTVIRSSALNGLAGSIAPQDLWTLFEKETNKELRLQMVSIFGSMQAMDQLTRIVKTEKDPEVRRRAVRVLGQMKPEKTGQLLVDVYASEQDVETRKAVISALSTQNNAEGLVAIARKESSLALKTDIVRKLSEMAPRSKVAADYLMEIIK